MQYDYSIAIFLDKSLHSALILLKIYKRELKENIKGWQII